jgi:hypothetical protein
VTIQLVGVWVTKKEFKKQIKKLMTQFIHYIGKTMINYLEEITAGGTTFLVLSNVDFISVIYNLNVNWSNEVIRMCFSLTTSIISAYIVNRLKNKYWNKNGNNI